MKEISYMTVNIVAKAFLKKIITYIVIMMYMFIDNLSKIATDHFKSSKEVKIL